MIDPAIVMLAEISGVVSTVLAGIIIYKAKKEKRRSRNRPSVFNDLKSKPVNTPIATAVMDVVPEAPASSTTFEPLTTTKPSNLQESGSQKQKKKVEILLNNLQSKDSYALSKNQKSDSTDSKSSKSSRGSKLSNYERNLIEKKSLDSQKLQTSRVVTVGYIEKKVELIVKRLQDSSKKFEKPRYMRPLQARVTTSEKVITRKRSTDTPNRESRSQSLVIGSGQ